MEYVMALITRLSRLFRADFNAVLDRMEEPEILLKQALREMEEALAKDQQQVKWIELELKQLESRYHDIERRLKPVSEELDLCLESGNEALARTLLKRKLESSRYLDYLDRRREEQQEACQTLHRRIEENRSRLESMQQKAALFTRPDEEAHPVWYEPDFRGQFTVTEDDVEIALLGEKQRRAQS
jgi:phage shock protein A